MMIQYVVLRCDVENKMCQHRDEHQFIVSRETLNVHKKTVWSAYYEKKSMLQLADLR